MKVLNLIWGFSLGAGIDKCFLTYAKLGSVDNDVEVKSLCINILNLDSHIGPLHDIGADFIDIKSKKDFSWISRLAEYINSYKPDIIFTHGFNGAIIILIERFLKGIDIKTIFTYHGAYNAPTKIKKIIEPLYNFLSIWVYKHIGYKTISVAEYSRQYLLSKGVPDDKAVTVHNGIVDISLQKHEHEKFNVVKIMTASRIDAVKGLKYMLEAIAILKTSDILFHYYMLGEGPKMDEMKAIASEKKLSGLVTFNGFQSNIPVWLDSADIFAIPSVYENHSIAILEAMRAGKAIVATDVGGNGESITDGVEGLLVPARDSHALADALERLIKDKSLRDRLSKAARQRYEREFTEEAMMRNIIAVLKS